MCLLFLGRRVLIDRVRVGWGAWEEGAEAEGGVRPRTGSAAETAAFPLGPTACSAAFLLSSPM